jgi:aspartyl/asparaginyl beta-hydroxylase (cupin superfamily)
MGRTTPAAHSAEVRRRYAAIIDQLQSEGKPELARQCAELAVGQGVWREVMQRPLQFTPSVPSRPRYDAGALWFVASLEAAFPRLRAELDAIVDPARQGFLPVDEALVGAGRWDQVTFWDQGECFEQAALRFPVTASVLAEIPEATTLGPGVATLSWLHPGTRIVPHCGASNARLRVHLGLRCPDGARLRVGDEILYWEEGKCLVFDDSFEHEVWHDGVEPRVVLLLDVPHPELGRLERDVLLAQRGSTEAKVRRYMIENRLERIEAVNGHVSMRADQGIEAMVRRYMEQHGAVAVELREGELHFEAA